MTSAFVNNFFAFLSLSSMLSSGSCCIDELAKAWSKASVFCALKRLGMVTLDTCDAIVCGRSMRGDTSAGVCTASYSRQVSRLFFFSVLVLLASKRTWCFTPNLPSRLVHDRRTELTKEFVGAVSSTTSEVEIVSGGTDIDSGAGDDDSAFQVLAGNVARCLVRSDLKRSAGNDGASTGWTAWVDEASAFRLQCCMDAICLSIPVRPSACL